MIDLKDLINDLGGGRSVGLGALLLVFMYVASDRYVDSIEAKIEGNSTDYSILEKRLDKLERWQGVGARFTAREGQELRRRIEILERHGE